MDRAQDILDQMSEAGLEPGPRAIHVLLFAYVKAKMAHEALEVARRCREQSELVGVKAGVDLQLVARNLQLDAGGLVVAAAGCSVAAEQRCTAGCSHQQF